MAHVWHWMALLRQQFLGHHGVIWAKCQPWLTRMSEISGTDGTVQMETLEGLQVSPHTVQNLHNLGRPDIVLSWRKESRDWSKYMIYNLCIDVYATDIKATVLRKKLSCVSPCKAGSTLIT